MIYNSLKCSATPYFVNLMLKFHVMSTTSIFVRNEAITTAEAAYQEALCKLVANEITLDECLMYQLAVFEACSKSIEPFKLSGI
jgi:hypothetical protein